MTEKKDAIVKVDNGLTRREEAALRMHLEANDPPLAPALSAQMFELFLNGMSCEEIQQRHRGVRLGAIVRAARDGDWHERRVEYMQSLLDGVRPRVQQAQSRAIMFVSDAIDMFNKRYGDKIQKFLQTGDEKDLGDLKDWGLPQFKQLIELFMKLTGQDGQKRVGVKVEHNGTVTHEHADAPLPGKAIIAGPPTPEDAEKFLEAIAFVPAPEDKKKQ